MTFSFRAFFRLLVLCLSANLCSFAGAQSGTTLLVKTDMACNWKLDGQAMGQLLTDESKVVLVSPGEHLIEASASPGPTMLRTKVEVDKVEKTVDIRLKSKAEQQQTEIAKVHTGGSLPPTWTDPASGLMWNRRDNGSDVDWLKATDYCAKLKLAGHTDWRLPSIEELEGIYDPHHSFKANFDNGVTYNVHVKGNLQLTGWSWSSTQGEGAGQPWQQARLLNFGFEPGSVYLLPGRHDHNFMTFDYSMRALCVRNGGDGKD